MEVALGQFGDDFDLAPFKLAYETTTDFESYNRVQAQAQASPARSGTRIAGRSRPRAAASARVSIISAAHPSLT